jgi:hypothetical protein
MQIIKPAFKEYDCPFLPIMLIIFELKIIRNIRRKTTRDYSVSTSSLVKKVIVLVDEHDTPLTNIHSEMSLGRPEENKELMESIDILF